MVRSIWLLLAGLSISSCSGDDGTVQVLAGTNVDEDEDGWHAAVDCDDTDAGVFPGAEEVPYDGIDQDCSGSDLTDVDRDGLEAAEVGGADCDDRRSDISPRAVDVCGDGIDQDCSGTDQACGDVDRDGDKFAPNDGDCNDEDASVHPERAEVPYNDKDDDCSPETPDDDADGDDFSPTTGGDCNDDNADIFPGADETPYDGIDQDCSGSDLTDVDGDGDDGGPEGSDCDDLNPLVHPARIEIVFDGIDQNCDGSDSAGVDAFKAIGSDEAVFSTVPSLSAGKDAEGEPVVLATWADSRDAPGQDVYGQLLDENGDPVAEEFVVVNGGLKKSRVRAAFDGERFLVVWQLDIGGVAAQRVNLNGSLEGIELGIGGEETEQPVVAFNGTSYLVAWKDAGIEPPEVHARQVMPNGVRGADETVESVAGLVNVAVGSNGSGFLVAWDGGGVTAQRLMADATKAGGAITVSTQPWAFAPDVVSDGSGYLVSFLRTAAPFSARAELVTAKGELLDGDPVTSTRLSLDSDAQSGLRGVYGPLGYFVAWADQRHPGFGAIYGRGLSSSGAPLRERDVPLHVTASAQLGGLAAVGNRLMLASQDAGTAGVIVF